MTLREALGGINVGTLAGLSAAIAVGAQSGLLLQALSREDTAAGFAADLELAPEAAELVLEVYRAAGLLTRRGDRYRMSDEVAADLLREPVGPEMMGMLWSRLPDFLASGGALAPPDRAVDARSSWYEPVVAGLARSNAPAAQMLAEHLGGEPLDILDVGAGGGTWSLPMAHTHAASNVLALDGREVLAVFTDRAETQGLTDRVSTMVADFHSFDVPEASFDRVILGNVLHLEPGELAEALVVRAARALRPRGQLIIVEPQALGPPAVALSTAVYSLHLRMRHASGRVHPPRAITAWLHAAGLELLEDVDLGSHIVGLHALVACAPGLVRLTAARDPGRFGGKAVALGALARQGLPVPPGFALDEGAIAQIQAGNPRSLKRLTGALAELGGAVAVRSSAVGEDGDTASFAGQHATVLGVRTAGALIDALEVVHASGRTPAAMAYRTRQGVEDAPVVAVVVQRLVAPVCAGVMFTRHPITGADERLIEASWGLGEVVVSGLVEPDRFRVARGGRVLERTPGHKDRAVVADGAGTVEIDIVGERGGALCLGDEELARLDLLATRCEGALGGGRDIEWAFADGTLYLLQSRPITGASSPGTSSSRTG